MENDKQLRYMINIDILSIFKIGMSIQWNAVRDNSIYRILYLSSVLYSFRYPEKKNPFSIYNFSVDNSGPFDANISKSITFLIKDDYIQRTEGMDVYRLGNNQIDESFNIDFETERIDWIKQVLYILAIYGENKIYEFIFRDPEYQNNLKSNTSKSLNINSNNETIDTLKRFEEAFKDSFSGEIQSITSQRYLELYFEYVFGKILKRED